jgi:hypothetical protein
MTILSLACFACRFGTVPTRVGGIPRLRVPRPVQELKQAGTETELATVVAAA